MSKNMHHIYQEIRKPCSYQWDYGKSTIIDFYIQTWWVVLQKQKLLGSFRRGITSSSTADETFSAEKELASYPSWWACYISSNKRSQAKKRFTIATPSSQRVFLGSQRLRFRWSSIVPEVRYWGSLRQFWIWLFIMATKLCNIHYTTNVSGARCRDWACGFSSEVFPVEASLFKGVKSNEYLLLFFFLFRCIFLNTCKGLGNIT